MEKSTRSAVGGRSTAETATASHTRQRGHLCTEEKAFRGGFLAVLAVFPEILGGLKAEGRVVANGWRWCGKAERASAEIAGIDGGGRRGAPASVARLLPGRVGPRLPPKAPIALCTSSPPRQTRGQRAARALMAPQGWVRGRQQKPFQRVPMDLCYHRLS